jgi:Zn-dependent peptidase ImmA (M78 family)/transcriptional regulator with XRE-family HTH domain
MPRVNPEILKWARESSGLTRGQAAKKLGIGNSDRLRRFEDGEIEPTRKQLLNMADKYRRPLLAFYLPAPPKSRDRGHDFRSLPEPPPPDSEAILDTLLRSVQAKQELVKAALEETDETEVLEFVGTSNREQGAEFIANAIVQRLGFSLRDFRAQENPTKAFAYLRAVTEKIGVFVLLMGHLGTHHTNIEPRVFRGFALADSIAPFIVINENDSRAAWSFTLLHELAHVWLGQTAISGYTSEDVIERLCDDIAARVLLPSSELNEFTVQAPALPALIEQISGFASARNVSRKMVAYNLLRRGFITAQLYRSLSDEFDADRIRQKQEREEREGEGGPNYYTVRKHRIGPGLLSLVGRMVNAGALSTPKAGTVLGVKPTAVGRLVADNRAA